MSKNVRRASTRIITGAIASLALAAGAVLAAAPAHAAAPKDCGLGVSCLYSGYDYGNDWLQNYQTLRFSWCIDEFTNYWYNDITSSFFNNGRKDDAYLWEHENQAGRSKKIVRGTGIRNLGSWNDMASSAYFKSEIGNTGGWRCE
jgi:hypothetical protein